VSPGAFSGAALSRSPLIQRIGSPLNGDPVDLDLMRLSMRKLPSRRQSRAIAAALAVAAIALQ
jgi:hypothetical protein